MRIGRTIIREKDRMVLVYVPAGVFTMGGEMGARDETPVHTVRLDAFWIDRTEVTNAMYQECVASGACLPPSKGNSSGWNEYDDPQYSDYPVIYVDWNDANAYCLWVGSRLPSEAEWEKAARGTDSRIYPWGMENYDNRANYEGMSTEPVGSYEDGKSPYGAYDMAGNVWEWVNDWYGETYYNRSPFNNPPGPLAGTYRILRGGAWSSTGYGPKVTTRYWVKLSYSNDSIGFRCARSSL